MVMNKKLFLEFWVISLIIPLYNNYLYVVFFNSHTFSGTQGTNFYKFRKS